MVPHRESTVPPVDESGGTYVAESTEYRVKMVENHKILTYTDFKTQYSISEARHICTEISIQCSIPRMLPSRMISFTGFLSW